MKEHYTFRSCRIKTNKGYLHYVYLWQMQSIVAVEQEKHKEQLASNHDQPIQVSAVTQRAGTLETTAAWSGLILTFFDTTYFSAGFPCSMLGYMMLLCFWRGIKWCLQKWPSKEHFSFNWVQGTWEYKFRHLRNLYNEWEKECVNLIAINYFWNTACMSSGNNK